ncbi:unnamed protein product [Debaryomyces tyrocola]|nr:unnamed protein product [Debaryomyces tyrocola]
MDRSVTKETYDKMFHLSHANLQNPINSRGNTIYRLPLYQTDLENYKNSYCSKDSPYATPNENRLPCDKSDNSWIMATEGSEANKLKENVSGNAILGCSKADKPSYEKQRASLLRTQLSRPTVGLDRSRITQEIYQAKSKPYTEVQFVCTPSLSGSLNTEFKDRSGPALNLPLADDNSKLDLSTLPKRKNTQVAPFCNEVDLYEENNDDSILLNLFTEEIKLNDTDYKETPTTHVPVLKKLLNGLKYYFDFLKSEAGQRRRTKNVQLEAKT